MKKGNMNIKDTKTYPSETRKKITASINREYKKLKDKDPDGMTFATHMLEVLTKEGFKAPDGSPLTHRGVRYQVLRSGIGFRGARPIPAPIVRLPSAVRQTATPVEPLQAKREVLKALSGVDNLVRSILSDTTIPAERAVAAVRALLQESTQ